MIKKTVFALLTILFACVTAGEPEAQSRSLGIAPDGSFTIVVIPDTQGYRGGGAKEQPQVSEETTNPVFEAHTRWIVDNIESQRIVFVSHSGDIVDRNIDSQWRVARKCMDRLHGRVPYGISPGNHDMTPEGDSSLFQRYFPASRFREFDWYGGFFPGNAGNTGISGNNANSCQLISIEGIGFIILHLECNSPDEALQGGCASRPGMAATAITGRELDIPVINLGFSGSGKMEPEMAGLLGELDPSAYVLDCLWNMDARMVKERVEPFVRALRRAHPETPIFLAEDSSYRNVTPTEKGRIVNSIYEKLAKEGMKGLYWISNRGMLGADSEGTVDGCHPNDLGMMRQAEVFVRDLAPVLKSARGR